MVQPYNGAIRGAGCELANAPMKIALWGYGVYGKRLYKAIRDNWGGLYRITAVFDSSIEAGAEATLEDGTPLLNSARISEMYHAGCFDAVIVAVAKTKPGEEIGEFLKRQGIPTTTLMAESDFLPAECFGERCVSYELPFGFTAHAYESIYGFYAPLFGWGAYLYLFDEYGQPLVDNWFKKHFPYDPCALNPAFPLCTGRVPIVSLAGDYCAITRNWANNYWHFTYQALDQVSVMEKAGYEGKYLIPQVSFADELVRLAGIDAQRIMWLDDFDRDAIYQFEKMHIISEEAYRPRQSASALLEIVQTIVANANLLEDDGGEFPSRLFVRRIGTRRLLGADDVLNAYGFQTIVPEDLSVAEQIKYFAHADVVVSPHGANSTNSLYMRPGSAFIETFGKGYINYCCTETLRKQGVYYFPIVESSVVSAERGSSTADYRIDATILAMAIESAIRLVEGAH